MRDGYIIPFDCYGEIEKGAYDGIDVMIGTNADELRYFIIEFGSYFLYKIVFNVMVENVLYYRIKKNGYEIYNEFKKYEKDNCYEKLLTDIFFRVPALKIAQLHSKNNGNVYLYYWTYPSSIPYFGACHAIELSYVLNNLQETELIGNQNINYKLAEVSQDMWANFAKNGNPSTKEYKWEKYDCKIDNFMVFGKEIENKTNLFNKDRNELIFPLLNEYISSKYIDLYYNVPYIRKRVLIFLTIFIIILSILLNKFLAK